MATIAQNILIDLNSLRIVRENNHLVGQRSFNFTEGNDYTGQINLIKNGIAYAGTISSLVIEIGNSQNDVALVRYEGTTKDFNLSFVGDLLRQYLYNSASKESVFSIGLTVDGLPVIIDDVATVLIANPSDNTGGTSWDSVTGKPSTFTPSAHTHAKSEVGLGNVDNTADADKTVSHASTADNSDTVTSLEGHKVSELSNDSGFLNDVSGATVARANEADHATVAEAAYAAGSATYSNNGDAINSLFDGTGGNVAKAGTVSSLASHSVSELTNDLGFLTSVSKSDIGLGNVDNTFDFQKSVDYAESAGVVSSLNGHNVSELTNDLGFLTSVSKSDIGLGNVDNTADADKSVSHAETANSTPSAVYATNATNALNSNFADQVYVPAYDDNYSLATVFDGTGGDVLKARTVVSLSGHNISELTNNSGFATVGTIDSRFLDSLLVKTRTLVPGTALTTSVANAGTASANNNQVNVGAGASLSGNGTAQITYEFNYDGGSGNAMDWSKPFSIIGAGYFNYTAYTDMIFRIYYTGSGSVALAPLTMASKGVEIRFSAGYLILASHSGTTLTSASGVALTAANKQVAFKMVNSGTTTTAFFRVAGSTTWTSLGSVATPSGVTSSNMIFAMVNNGLGTGHAASSLQSLYFINDF